MNNYLDYFTNYVQKNYDMSNPLINKKYYHSLRVAKLMILLAKKLNLSEEDTLLAFKIGLCHDLGRFREVVRSGEFNNQTFDHGAYSNKILYNDEFIKYMDIKDHLLFRKAIYCHNKIDLTNNLTEREKLFANMVRDMDKIDILGLRAEGRVLNFNNDATPAILDNYMNNEKIYLGDIHCQTDSAILYLSFIKDLVFDASYDIAVENGYLDSLLSIINISDDKKELFDSIMKKLYERRNGYVR